MHLHSGIERASYFLQRIADAEEQGELRREVLQDFVAALEGDRNRRLAEIRVLVKELSRLQAENERYLGAIVGHEEAALLRGAMGGLSEEERQQITEGYRKGVGQGRRIDYLFHISKPPNIPQECLRQELLGTSAAVVAQPSSDHYGVMNTYILDPIQC